MSKIEGVLVVGAFTILSSILIFGSLAPKYIKRKDPQVKDYLIGLGYKDPKLIGVSGWKNEMYYSYHNDSSVTDSSVTDSSVTDSSVADSSVTDSSVTDSSVTDSSVTDSSVTIVLSRDSWSIKPSLTP